MPDVFTKAKRSEVMSRIRGRGNKTTEQALAKLMRRHGITGWRRNQKIFGKPDFIFPKLKLAFLWTVVSGTVVPSMQRNPQPGAS